MVASVGAGYLNTSNVYFGRIDSTAQIRAYEPSTVVEPDADFYSYNLEDFSPDASNAYSPQVNLRIADVPLSEDMLSPADLICLQMNADSGEEAINPVDGESSISAASAVTSVLPKGKIYTQDELKDLLPLLQKADIDKNGTVTEQELKMYEDALHKQREELNKMTMDKMVMDAISNIQMSRAKEQAHQQINKQLHQIETLMHKDSSDVSTFSKLGDALGSGGGLSISKLIDTINTLAQSGSTATLTVG